MFVMLIHSLEEGGVITECSIKTHEAVETLDFEFYGSTVVNKIIMKVIMSSRLTIVSRKAKKKHSNAITE